MSPEEKVAYINAQVACAMIQAMGMQAENEYRRKIGEPPRYRECDFGNLPVRFGIHHSALVAFFES
jgi:hypothetical protein